MELSGGTLQLSLNAKATKADDISTPTDDIRLKYQRTFADSDTSSPTFVANQLYRARRTVTLATLVDDVDLYGLLENVFGEQVNFLTVYFVFVVNTSTTSGDKITVGGAGSANNAWGAPFDGDQDAKMTVGPNSFTVLADLTDGFAITAGSQDVLRVGHDGVSQDIDYDIVICGEQLV